MVSQCDVRSTSPAHQTSKYSYVHKPSGEPPPGHHDPWNPLSAICHIEIDRLALSSPKNQTDGRVWPVVNSASEVRPTLVASTLVPLATAHATATLHRAAAALEERPCRGPSQLPRLFPRETSPNTPGTSHDSDDGHPIRPPDARKETTESLRGPRATCCIRTYPVCRDPHRSLSQGQPLPESMLKHFRFMQS